MAHHQSTSTTEAANMNVQAVFRALADPSRREILIHLSKADMTIAEVSNHFPMTRGAIKKHLTILHEGNLISVHPRGRERVNRLEPKAMKSAADWMSYFSQFWDDKLSNLQTAIDNHQQTDRNKSND